jgi:hypothetical protein
MNWVRTLPTPALWVLVIFAGGFAACLLFSIGLPVLLARRARAGERVREQAVRAEEKAMEAARLAMTAPQEDAPADGSDCHD